MIIQDEHKKIVEIFQQHEKSFSDRKQKIEVVAFSKINWSDSYLSFTPYDAIINQLEVAKIFKNEKPDSIKNHFFEDKLVYSYKTKNQNWGSIFIDYQNNYDLWLLFVENYDDEMMLQQLKLAYHQNNRITKKIFYLFDKDAEEETLMVDLLKYNKEGKLECIVRNGFYEVVTNVLPERKISFIYENEKVSIYSEQEIGNDLRRQLIYDGKELRQ